MSQWIYPRILSLTGNEKGIHTSISVVSGLSSPYMVENAYLSQPELPFLTQGPLDDPESDQPISIYKKALRELQQESSFKPVPTQPKIKSCLMFSSSSQSYQESFPPLERCTDPQTKVVSQPYIQSPITTSGAPEAPKQYEAVLNWQTQNASAQTQNQALHYLGKKIDNVASQVSQIETKVDTITSWLEQIYSNLQNRISELDIDLITIINNRIWGPKFNKKAAEIRKLKAELAIIDADKAQPSLFTKTQSISIPVPLFTSYQPFYNPPKQSTYDQFFGLSHFHNVPSVPSPTTTSPKRSKSKVKISKPPPKEDLQVPKDSPKVTPEPTKKDKAPAYQYRYQQIDTQNNDSDSTSEESLPSSDHLNSSEQTFSDSESQYVDISGFLMATKTEDPSTSTHVVDTPIAEESSDDNNVLREFCSIFTGSLRNWFESLGEYRQLQLIQTTVLIALAIIYEQFLGEPAADIEASRKEYHQMKCCSLNRHHLEMHYKRMSMLYYKLNGFNDPSLKHVFAASLPSKLQPELQRQLTTFNLDIANVSLGKIFQLTMFCLDKICEQKDFFKDLIEHKEPFTSACKKAYLKIQCKDDKKCTCPTTKKKHFQKHIHRSSSTKPKKPYRYFRQKDPSQFRKKKHNRCFICKKRGHFAHNCPNKSTKFVHLIQHLQQSSILSNNEDVESIFLEQSEKDDHTTFILADSTYSDPDDISVISTIQDINHIRPTLPGPSVKISVIPSKFHKPVSVIGFLDTGAQRNMLNPKIFPPYYWDNHTEYFRAANGKVF
ncbi:hypothetical protein KPL71_012046 [Citrus sinensis]|uniref:Uncharacterized protein n=1 Tax=Citrus sinensis TaxID=2711 RepID=A0ACB8L874_CITSI|nr:hypothetical protein KPL71_012046 [Citrus sinensis]